MIDKSFPDIPSALACIKDGDTVLVGGFGVVGQPNALIEGLIAHGARDLCIVANNAGFGEEGLPAVFAAGLVRKLICSFPKGSRAFQELHSAGKVELEVVPQGTLAERLRAAGAGVPAFYTPTGVGTLLAEGKEVRNFNGRDYLLEHALSGDVALLEAWAGDRWGNLSYRGAGRNFNPVMAMAARTSVVQVHNLVAVGDIDPDLVGTPGIFINRVVPMNPATAITGAITGATAG